MRRKFATIAISVASLVACDRSPAVDPATAPATTTSSASTLPGKRMHFEHHEFVLDLDPSWTAVPGTDPELFQFESEPLDSALTISIMPAAIPQAEMQPLGEKLLEFRRQAEVAADLSRVVTFGDQWVTPKPDGEVVEVAYAGYDNRGRIFRFIGFVTTQKVVSFYCETVSKEDEQAKRIFDETFRGFRFYVP